MSNKTLKSGRDFFTLAGIELTKAMDKRLKVAREGRTPAWEREQYNEIEHKFKKEADKIASSMMEAARAEADKLAIEARVLRNRPSSPLKPKDGNMMLYHQNRISNLLDGLSEQEAIREYSFNVSILNDDERPYLHVYEDVLMSKMKDPAYKQLAKEEIFKYKSAKEKIAQTLAERAEKEVEELETIAAIIKHDIERAAKGEKIPNYSYHDLFEEIGSQEAAETIMKINPYAGDPVSGESE